MRPITKFLTAGAYVLALAFIGITDAVVTRGVNVLPALPAATENAPPEGGVQRTNGPDVFSVFTELGFVTEQSREESLLSQVVPRKTVVESRVLLQKNDRLAYIAWVESPDAKVYFTALKEALSTAFSSELQDLVDETQERAGKPVRNVLSFLDPGIHEERLLFVRVRQRLYEFHVAPGKEPEVQGLMDALTE